jgi:hypothetical protein
MHWPTSVVEPRIEMPDRELTRRRRRFVAVIRPAVNFRSGIYTASL